MSRDLQSSIWGPIPSDWEVKPLKSISPSQSVGLVINPSTYFDPAGQIPMLVGSNVSENRIDSSRSNRITEESNSKLPASRLRYRDLVVVRVGAPGITAVVPRELDGANCASMMIVRQHKSFSSEWLCAAFNSPIGREQIEGVQYGTAQKQFNISDAVNFVFPCPPLAEQEAIAEALSDADALIEGLERLIAKKRLIKQGAMQDLLTAKRRLPGFSGEWETKRLSEIGQVKTGLTYSPKNVSSYGTLVLRSSNIQEDRLAFLDNVYVDVDVSDEATVRTGDLLICVRNGSRQLIGKTAMIDERADGMAFGAFMSAYRSHLNDYLIWCFQSSVIQKQVAEHLGATINQITNKTLKGIEVPIPAQEEERTAIADVLTDMDAEIQALDTRLEKARQVKEGMMQNLLTGRIRLV